MTITATENSKCRRVFSRVPPGGDIEGLTAAGAQSLGPPDGLQHLPPFKEG